jgi:preprotein translocase subunit SecF
VLLRDPVQLTVAEEEGVRRVRGQLAFEDAHPPADVAAAFAGSGLSDVAVEPVAGQLGAYTFDARVDSDAEGTELVALVSNLFRDASDGEGRQLALASPIPESSVVGAEVSGELRDKAVQAVLLSLFATVLYIRVRFHEYAYGLAVVAALAHIVIFDRVRENLPRVKGSLSEILDLSINQTLSRTLLTALTMLLAVLVLFAFNVGTRNTLEGFTFAMLVGILSGTYSTIFIACPVLHWLEMRSARKAAGPQDAAKAA